MLNYIFIAVVAFCFGFMIAKLSKKDEVKTCLDDLKKNLDEYIKNDEKNRLETQYIVKSAVELNKLLTTNQNLKGKFGEDCLENVIKYCFPQNKLNYIKQYSTLNSDDKSIKPDYLINLPNDKNMIIDCKLNLEKYIEYKQASDEIKLNKKKELIADINSTVNSLANKKYETAKNLIQPDFILMYIPLESVLTLIYTDSDFLSVVKNANEKNIIIVGNSSILTTLRLVNLLWAQNKQQENIENIINIAQNIYDLIANHSQNLYNLKQIINQNTETFNKEFEKFSANSKIFKETQKLKEFGLEAKNKKIGSKISTNEIQEEFLK